MDESKKPKAEDILSSADGPMSNEAEQDQQWHLAKNIKDIISFSGNETLDPQRKAAIWNHITGTLPGPAAGNKKTKIFHMNRWAVAAASVLLLVSTAIYLRSHDSTPTQQHIARLGGKHQQPILPGANKAVLTLAGGKRIILNNAKSGFLTLQGGTKVNKTAEGQIAYQSGGSSVAPVQMNSISTPRGGQYQIILPDGTKAWLNAASSLQFPTAFTGGARNVKMTGEVYFEVAKNKNMPFKVDVNGAIVEVLGTHFNIKSYGDEKELSATLLEGSVKVSKNGAPVILLPGQQALVDNSSGAIQVRPANTNVVLGWKKGMFIFKKQNFKSILRDVSRWYDLDVVYEPGFIDQDFSGSISRFKNISDVLQLLELTEDVHFKIEGRRVTVMP